ncbi:ABC transporter permease [Melioribacteraceae bacterium 4301-Me]|uniref:ABC transporter permease n=1 Tax=Pyranulibacter aquaticus TaxID=3163344 RepID=UPI00359B48F6
MLFKLAWRNLWRNKRRSLIIQLSVVVGVIAIITLDSLTNGMLYQMLFNQISTSVSYIQIHKKGFKDNKVVQNFIPDYHKAEETIKNDPLIKSYSKRVITFGLISSAVNSSGIYINGIIPDEEAKVSIIKSSVKEGKYFTGGMHEIVIGEKLAEKLEVGLGDKIVIMSNTLQGNVGSDLYRIVGLFKTFSSDFDKTNIYIPLQSAQQLLGIGDKIHEFAMITDNYKNAPKVASALAKQLGPKYEVLPYNEILPLLVIQLDLYKQSSFIVTLIVSLALIFGIINTMLMAVFERIREFGVLMSIGMKNGKLFSMIIAEAFILGVIGTVVGTALGLLIQLLMMNSGLNLSIFAQSLDSFGLGSIIYPVISFENTFITFLTIPIVAVIGALYPAIKAIKLQPVYALRYV